MCMQNISSLLLPSLFEKHLSKKDCAAFASSYGFLYFVAIESRCWSVAPIVRMLMCCMSEGEDLLDVQLSAFVVPKTTEGRCFQYMQREKFLLMLLFLRYKARKVFLIFYLSNFKILFALVILTHKIIFIKNIHITSSNSTIPQIDSHFFSDVYD